MYLIYLVWTLIKPWWVGFGYNIIISAQILIISVQIYLLTNPVVYQQFYFNSTFTRPISASWTRKDLNFPDKFDFQWVNSNSAIYAEFFTAIKFEASGTLKVSWYWDDEWDLYLDDTKHYFEWNRYSQSGVFSYDAQDDRYYWTFGI